MALNSFFEIPKWQSSRHDPDAAGPVAADPPSPPPRATRIVIANDGQVEFRDEVALTVNRGRHLDLTVEPQTSRRPPQLTNTIEVKCRDTKCGINQTVVISAFPYGFDWFAASRFKPYRYHGRRKDAKATASAYELIHVLQTALDPQAVLESAKFDPFETRAGWLTARFVGPFERTEGGHVTVRTRRQAGPNRSMDDLSRSSVNWMPHDRVARKAELVSVLTAHFGVPGNEPPPEPVLGYLGLSSESGDSRRMVSPYLLWGLCEDFEECRSRLHNCEQSEKWLENPEELLSNARLRLKRPGYELAAEADELFYQLAEPVLDSSIIKALAGMPAKPPSHWKNGVRRLVIDLVAVIYQDSMLNLAKRLGSKPGTEFQENDRQLPEVRAHLDVFDFKTAEDEKKSWQKVFMQKPPNAERLFHAARTMLESDEEQDIVSTCGLLAAAAPIMTVPPDVIMRLEQLAKEKASDLVARGARYALSVIGRHNSVK